jgi:hypothetical protein
VLRARKRWSLAMLSEKSGVDITLVQMLERGGTDIEASKVIRVMEALDHHIQMSLVNNPK